MNMYDRVRTKDNRYGIIEEVGYPEIFPNKPTIHWYWVNLDDNGKTELYKGEDLTKL